MGKKAYYGKLRKLMMLGAATGMLLMLTIVLISINSSAQFYANIDYVGNTEIQFHWTERGSDTFLRYEIHRNDVKIYEEHDNTTTTYEDTEVTEGLEYNYTIEAWYWDEEEEEEFIGNEAFISEHTAGDVWGTPIFDIVWTSEDGPYYLVENVIIDGDGELTINPGTTIYTDGWHVQGADPEIDDVTVYGGLTFIGAQGLTVTNSVFHMDAEDYLQAGLEIFDCHEVTITGNEFNNYNPGGWPADYPGIRFDEHAASVACTDVQIYDNTFDNCHYGIYGIRLRDSAVDGNYFTDSYYGLAISTELLNSEVRHNTFDRFEKQKSLSLGLWVANYNTPVFDNTFTDLGQAIAMYGEDSECYDNTIIDCTDGIQVSGTGLEVFMNSIDSDGAQGQGIDIAGNQHSIHDNTITEFMHAGIICFEEIWDCVITRNEISLGDYGIYLTDDWNENITVTDNHIHNNTDDGIFLEKASNFTVENNRILSLSRGNGIALKWGCSDNVFKDNTIYDIDESGILLGTGQMYGGNEWNTFQGNKITDVDKGIEFAGEWDVNSGYLQQDNNTFWNNVISGANYGMWMEGASNNTFIDNTLKGIVSCGIMVESYWDYYWDRSAYCFYNEFQGTVITTQNAVGIGIEDECQVKTFNEFNMVTIGNTHPTKISIKDQNETLKVRGVDYIPGMPAPPDHTSSQKNISNFIDIWYEGAPFELTFHYTNEQVGTMPEPNLWIWKYYQNETGSWVWDDDRNTTVWKTHDQLSIVNNEISSKIGNSSWGRTIYAPLIGTPVHNINTNKDYNTIQEAIDDLDTAEGDTITVDPEYTVSDVRENVIVSKSLNIRSSSGNPENTIINGFDEFDHTITIDAEPVTIEGFTVRGATAIDRTGIFVRESLTIVNISNCIITGNYVGIFFNCNWEGQMNLKSVQIYNNTENGINFTIDEDTGACIIIIEGNENVIRNNGLNGIFTMYCDVLIKGPTEIHNNGEWGIRCNGDLTILNGMMSSVNYNGKGGILSYDCSLPKNIEIAHNGGAGLVCMGEDPTTRGDPPDTTIELNSINVHDNVGNGIHGLKCNFEFKENGSKIINNQGHGITVDLPDSSIHIVGVTEIHDNGQFGIYTLGDVIIEEAAMSSINDNWEGGIFAAGLELPSDIEIAYNGGPGIVLVNDEVLTDGKCPESTLELDNVRIHENLGNGIETANYNLHFAGTGSLIQENEGHGIFTSIGPSWIRIEVEGTTISDNIGWGIDHTGYVDITVATQIKENINGGIRVIGECDDSVIQSTSLTGNDGYAIHLIGAQLYIADNLITGNTGGIKCELGSNGTISWNVIRNNSDHGVNNLDDTVTIDARNNWWGDTTGPGGEGPGIGDKVSDHVRFDPWTGAATTDLRQETVQGTGTMDSLDQSDTEVVYDTDSAITISTQSYETNPGEGFKGDIGKYIDVYLDSSERVNEIEIRLYYTEADLGNRDEATLRIYWWTGAIWQRCSETGVNTEDTGEYAGYIWARISSGGTPTLAQMTGTPFCGGEDAETDTSDEDDDDGIGAGLILGIVVIIVFVLLVVLVQMGLLPIGDLLAGSGDKGERGKEVKAQTRNEETDNGKKADSEIRKKEEDIGKKADPETGKNEEADNGKKADQKVGLKEETGTDVK